MAKTKVEFDTADMDEVHCPYCGCYQPSQKTIYFYLKTKEDMAMNYICDECEKVFHVSLRVVPKYTTKKELK